MGFLFAVFVWSFSVYLFVAVPCFSAGGVRYFYGSLLLGSAWFLVDGFMRFFVTYLRCWVMLDGWWVGDLLRTRGGGNEITYSLHTLHSWRREKMRWMENTNKSIATIRQSSLSLLMRGNS